MAVIYSQSIINARLNAVVTAIGAGGIFKLYAGGTLVAQVTMTTPCGTVSNGVLTFTTPLTEDSADATGVVDTAVITDSSGIVMISGLSVGIPLSGAEVIISNGVNTTLVTVGQIISLISAQITGS